MPLTVYSVLWQFIVFCVAYFQSELEHRCLKCDIDNHGNPLRVGMYTGERHSKIQLIIVSSQSPGPHVDLFTTIFNCIGLDWLFSQYHTDRWNVEGNVEIKPL